VTGTGHYQLHQRDIPGVVVGGFDLTSQESTWLRERILRAAPDTLLSHLLIRDEPPDPDSVASWDDSACLDAPDPARGIHGHARLFSLGMHGAAPRTVRRPPGLPRHRACPPDAAPGVLASSSNRPVTVMTPASPPDLQVGGRFRGIAA
jgi:hypothetical protein